MLARARSEMKLFFLPPPGRQHPTGRRRGGSSSPGVIHHALPHPRKRGRDAPRKQGGSKSGSRQPSERSSRRPSARLAAVAIKIPGPIAGRTAAFQCRAPPCREPGSRTAAFGSSQFSLPPSTADGRAVEEQVAVREDDRGGSRCAPAAALTRVRLGFWRSRCRRFPPPGGKKTDPPLLLLAERLFLFFSACRWMRQQIQKLAGSKLGNFRASLNCVCLLSRAGYF